MPGDFLDLSSHPEPPSESTSPPQNTAAPHRDGKDQPADARHHVARRFVGVHFACCDVYSRIYINQQGSGYVGYCPRCAKRVELKIGPGGSDSRFFTAY